MMVCIIGGQSRRGVAREERRRQAGEGKILERGATKLIQGSPSWIL